MNNIENLIYVLKTKYNYNDELINFLRILIPTMIEYYGKEFEQIIYNRFLETPIIIANKDYSSILGEEDKELLMAGGCYAYEIVIENSKPIKKDKVVKGSNVMKEFSFSDKAMVGSLVHEICHMVKSGISVDSNGNYIDFVGLAKTEGNISNNEFNKQTNYGRGLEEALNAIDETMIMQMIYGEYNLTSIYVILARDIYEMIKDNEEIRELIVRSQFYGNNEWFKYLGNEVSMELINLSDKLYDLHVHKLFELIKNESLQNEANNIAENIRNIVSNSKKSSNTL